MISLKAAKLTFNGFLYILWLKQRLHSHHCVIIHSFITAHIHNSTITEGNSSLLLSKQNVNPIVRHSVMSHITSVILKDAGTVIISKWTFVYCPGDGPSSLLRPSDNQPSRQDRLLSHRWVCCLNAAARLIFGIRTHHGCARQSPLASCSRVHSL